MLELHTTILLVGTITWTIDNAIAASRKMNASVVAARKLAKFTKEFYSTLNYLFNGGGFIMIRVTTLSKQQRER